MSSRKTTVDPPAKKDVLEVARASGKLGLFVGSLDPPIESGTLFAPTDDAFQAIEPARRKQVAKHHVVAGKVLRAEEFPAEGAEIPTSSGSTVIVRAENGEMYVDDLRVIARIEASNGVVYAIGGVVDPANPPDVRARIERINPSFAALVKQTTLLDGSGPFTVFVPTEAAMASLAPPIDPKKIVSRHAARGVIVAADLPKLRTLRMLGGPDIAPSRLHVVRLPSPAKNGAVYVIDTVL